ncbi:transposase [Thermoflexus hugenholtzii]|uniref:transposase n=1 Tax=Thermoflexus hugenholtzii TaxID=1495650 RepID=UPI00387F94AC
MGREGHPRRKGTKGHVGVNRRGLPLGVAWGPGNEHDSQKLKALREGVRLRQRGRGRPRTRPRVVYGDGAYDSEAIRAALRRRGIRAGIRENPRGRKKAQKGRPRCFDEKADPTIRRSVARFLAWRKGGFRRLSLKTRATSLHVSRLRLPCLPPHRLESFEMSSLRVEIIDGSS